MPPSLMETHSASALLFVRSQGDLPGALSTVNGLLSKRRSLSAADSDVLGIIICAPIDDELPQRWDGGMGPTGFESVGMEGIWSLRWFNRSAIGVSTSPDQGRRRLLDVVLPRIAMDRIAAARRHVLLPVFSCAEALQVEDHLKALEARYPTLAIGWDVFVDDPSRGGLVRLVGEDTPLHVERPS